MSIPVRAVSEAPQDGIDLEFATGLAHGEFRIQSCRRCHEQRWPATTYCPACSSLEHEWIASSGAGRMWSWIVMHRAYFPDAEAQLPYAIAFVELAEGPMVMARVVGADLACDAAVTFSPEQSRAAGIAVFETGGGLPCPTEARGLRAEATAPDPPEATRAAQRASSEDPAW